MITAISSINANNSKQANQIAFGGNLASLAKEEVGSKFSRFEKEAVDSFKKLAEKDELPVTSKAIITADNNPGPPIVDSLGNPIEDPDMPGTFLHELGKQAVTNHGDTIVEAIGHGVKAIFEALFG